MAKTGPIRAFLSYAHEDHGWRDRVLMHLGWLRNSGRLEHFDDRQLKPGESWDAAIQGELAEADIVIVLISPDFVGSAYCGLKELLVAARPRRSGGGPDRADRVRPRRSGCPADRPSAMHAAGRAKRSEAPGRLAQLQRAAGSDRGDDPRHRPGARALALDDGARARPAGRRPCNGPCPHRHRAASAAASPLARSSRRCSMSRPTPSSCTGQPASARPRWRWRPPAIPRSSSGSRDRRAFVALDKAPDADALADRVAGRCGAAAEPRRLGRSRAFARGGPRPAGPG